MRGSRVYGGGEGAAVCRRLAGERRDCRSARLAIAGLAIGAAFVAALPSAAQAQFASSRLGAGVSWETYRFSDAERVGIESLTLMSAPFGGAVALSRRVELVVSGAWARGELVRSDGTEAELDGLTDTDVRLVASLGRDAVTLTAIARLPTGAAELTATEADVAGMIAADVLPFRVSSWGTGGGFGASAAVARPVGAWALGLSVGYVVAGEFEPVADTDFSYRPGDQLHVRAAADRTFGTSGKGALSVSWQRYGEDEAQGANLFQTGDRWQALASYAFAAGTRGSGIVYAGYLHRSEGEYLAESRIRPAERLVFGGVGGRIPAGRTILQPGLDLRLHAGDEAAGSGYTVGLGGSAEMPLGAMRMVPTLRGRFGSVEVADGRDSGFTGAELAVAIRFGAGGR